MSRLRFLLDEHIAYAIRDQLLRLEPDSIIRGRGTALRLPTGATARVRPYKLRRYKQATFWSLTTAALCQITYVITTQQEDVCLASVC